MRRKRKKDIREHCEVRRFTEYVRCSCGHNHPIDEKGGMLTGFGFVVGYSRGEIYPLVETTDGTLVCDTGWY